MATSDYPHGSDSKPDASANRHGGPHLVNLPSSFDLTDFPSEASDAIEVASAQQPAETASHFEPAAEARMNTPEAATGGAAAVLEFPPPTPESAAVVPLPVLAARHPVTLVDLLEKEGGVNWREAVALVHQLCLQLKDCAPHAPILLEPRNIQITDTGGVRLLPGQTGGDPLVIQVGRLLHTMLMGRPAPPELRLLLAQATFELPIFESIEDVDRALRQLETFDDAKDARIADAPASLLPKVASIAWESIPQEPREERPIRPAPRPRRAAVRGMAPVGAIISRYRSRIIASAVAIVALWGLISTRPVSLLPSGSSAAPVTQGTFGTSEPALPQIGVPDTLVPTPSAVQPSPDGSARSSTEIPGARHTGREPGRLEPPRAENRPAVPDLSGRTSIPARATAIAATNPVPRDSERRAAALLAQGQTVKAAMVFDALVLANPLYEPNPTDLTPESLGAFRASQKVLLPVIAVRNYDRARTALASGDVDRALALGREVAAILDRPLADPPPNLREQVRELLDRATAARAAADEIVYTVTDTGIVHPRPISRQFPATTPIGVPPHRVGTLEMVIGKEGTVEQVKLHTPLNRYHERMIVSAAKAWLYRPATRNGRAVRFRLTVKVNLPESGTDY